MKNKYPYLTDEQNQLRICLKSDKGKSWWIYILYCQDDSLYTGITNNPIQRFVDHYEGKGAKYTRCNPPLEIMYLQEVTDKSTALKREYEIKQLSRQAKLELIGLNCVPSLFKIKV